MQTKIQSLVEAVTNTLSGLVLAFIVNMLLMGVAGVTASPAQNAIIVLGHTLVSVVRTYVIRRYFNKKRTKNDQAKATVLP